MSKPEDPSQMAEAPKPVIEQLQQPEPAKKPTAPYEPSSHRGYSLVSNEEKLSVSTNLQTPLLEARKSFAEKVGTERKAVNEDNNQNLKKSISDLSPAVNSPANSPGQQMEGKSNTFAERFKKEAVPATSGKTEPVRAEQKSSFVDRLQQEKAARPAPTTPPRGPRK